MYTGCNKGIQTACHQKLNYNRGHNYRLACQDTTTLKSLYIYIIQHIQHPATSYHHTGTSADYHIGCYGLR